MKNNKSNLIISERSTGHKKITLAEFDHNTPERNRITPILSTPNRLSQFSQKKQSTNPSASARKKFHNSSVMKQPFKLMD